jgi:hypothetical protein
MSFQAAEDRELILLVGNPESRLERDVRAELAQQLRTERMDRSALHKLHARAELLETRSYLIRRFVGEREDADSVGGDSKVLDQESNALDEAEGLPRTGSREDEDWPQWSLDRLALRGSRDARRV